MYFFMMGLSCSIQSSCLLQHIPVLHCFFLKIINFIIKTKFLNRINIIHKISQTQSQRLLYSQSSYSAAVEFYIGFYTFSIEYIFLLSATTKNEKNPTQIRTRKKTQFYILFHNSCLFRPSCSPDMQPFLFSFLCSIYTVPYYSCLYLRYITDYILHMRENMDLSFLRLCYFAYNYTS